MDYCINHPQEEALSFCHNCGHYYCETCLVEGKEYYYCKKPECQKQLKKELNPSGLPVTIVCPRCESELELSDQEKDSGKVHCPGCEAVLDITSGIPKILDQDHYVELLASLNHGDIGIIKSILDDLKIDYYVFGENFLTAEPLLQPARFFVNEDQLSEAKEGLKDFDLKIWGASKNQYGEEE